MPSSQTVQALDPRREYKDLSRLYLMLWSQLDFLLGDTKWLDIAPPQPVECKQAAEQAREALDAKLRDLELRKAIQSDYVRVQELTLHPGAAPKPDIESFKNYLRDEALRYAEDAYPL
jgi:hypothetical protein